MKPKPLTILLSLTFLFLFSGFVYGEESEVKREYWHSGGFKKETHFRDGKKNGLETMWYEPGTQWFEKNRKREETNYKDGKKDGASLLWDKDGRKQQGAYYANGKLDGL